MWYSNNGKDWEDEHTTAEKWLENHSGDEAVIRAVAEHLIRRKALLVDRRDLEPEVVRELVEGVIDEMTAKYGNLADVRRHSRGDSLSDLVMPYIPEGS
jgi:hypothetical protein